MKNKNIIVLPALLLFSLNINAQKVTNSGHLTKSKRINAYTWGAYPVTTISDNFNNLCRNIPQLISNPDSLQFKGYEYMATLQDKEEAVNYFLRNLHENASVVYYYNIGNKRYISVSTLHNFQRARSIALFNKWIDEAQILKGFWVYRIDFVINHQNIQHYVFVDPKTKQVVVTRDSIFGHIPQI